MGIQERKERERERRRQQIMVAAKRVFSLKGYNKTTMDDIAGEAELSPGTLYLYFKNKDELYASLSLRILQYLHIRLEHVIAEDGNTPEERVDALKEAMYDVYEFDSLCLINMFHLQASETLKSLSSELMQEMKALFASALSAIADIFNVGIKAGVYRDIHPGTVADFFWALFSGVVLWEESKKVINNNNINLKKKLKAAFDIFESGIRK